MSNPALAVAILIWLSVAGGGFMLLRSYQSGRFSSRRLSYRTASFVGLVVVATAVTLTSGSLANSMLFFGGSLMLVAFILESKLPRGKDDRFLH